MDLGLAQRPEVERRRRNGSVPGPVVKNQASSSRTVLPAAARRAFNRSAICAARSAGVPVRADAVEVELFAKDGWFDSAVGAAFSWHPATTMAPSKRSPVHFRCIRTLLSK